MCGPGPDRRLARRSGREDEAISAHNTLSAETQHVQVFYPFHPLHGATLQIIRRPKRGDGAVSVIDPTGRRLKIPVWMLVPECAEIKITERPHLSKEALLSLTSFLSTPQAPNDYVHDNLRQTPVDGCKGGERAPTTTFGPDDSRGRHGGAVGRKGARSVDRSHGPRAGGGLSNGRRKRE